MPRLIHPIDFAASPLDVAVQALSIARIRESARRNYMTVEERTGQNRQDFSLILPTERADPDDDIVHRDALVAHAPAVFGGKKP